VGKIDIPSKSTIDLLILDLPQLIQLTMQQRQLLSLEIRFPSRQSLVIPQRIVIHKLLPKIPPLVFPPFSYTLHRRQFIPGDPDECTAYDAEVIGQVGGVVEGCAVEGLGRGRGVGRWFIFCVEGESCGELADGRASEETLAVKRPRYSERKA
jgi:hypothetical protein